MTDTRPLLVGMNNPYNHDVEYDRKYALYPLPSRSAGGRLYAVLRERVLGLKRFEYLDAFDRRNLVLGGWTASRGRWGAAALHAELRGSGRTAVLLGRDVASSFGLPPCPVTPTQVEGAVYRQLPHPSGRNPWYNDPAHRAIAALLLEELFYAAV